MSLLSREREQLARLKALLAERVERANSEAMTRARAVALAQEAVQEAEVADDSELVRIYQEAVRSTQSPGQRP